MSLVIAPSADVSRVNYWADRVRTSLQRSVQSIIEAGLDLIEAKDELGDLRQVAEAAGLSKSTVSYLVKIAHHPVLSTRVDDLPGSWRALAELSSASPEEVEAWIEDGQVNPDLTVKAARELVQSSRVDPLGDPDEGSTMDEAPADTPPAKTRFEFAEDRDAAVFAVEKRRLEDATAVVTAPGFRLTVDVAQDLLRALRPLDEARSLLLQAIDDECGDLIDLPPFSTPRRVIPAVVIDPRDSAQVAGTSAFEARQGPHSAV